MLLNLLGNATKFTDEGSFQAKEPPAKLHSKFGSLTGQDDTNPTDTEESGSVRLRKNETYC